MDVLEREPAPRRRTRASSVALVAAGLVGGLTLASLGVAAAQSGPSPSPSAGSTAPRKMLREMRGMRGPGRFGGPGIHGEFTVKGANGGYETALTQVGAVTAVSPKSITVKSEDGYEKSYGIDANTLVKAGDNGIADVKKGDQVRVLARVVGGTAKAVMVGDVTNLKELRHHWRPKQPNAPTSTT